MSKDNNYLVRNQDNLIPPPDFNLNGEPDALSKYEYLRIKGEQPIQIPDAVMRINGEIFAANGDVYTFAGAPKSGKSAVSNMEISSSLTASGTIPDGLEGVVMRGNPDGKAVVHIDSEQATHKHEWNVYHIYKRAGFDACPSFFCSYNIRKLDLEQYTITTTAICEAANIRCGGVHSIWVDGGADYIADVNDPASSNAIIKYFEGLAIRFNTAVFVVIHTNPNSTKERGHMGSQMQRKSGGTLLITDEGEYSTVKAERLRYAGKADIPILKFSFDKSKGYHTGCGTMEASNDPDKKAESKMTDAWRICERIFSGQKSFSRKKVINQIMTKKACQERTAAGIFALMTAGDMILKGEDSNYRLNTQYSNELQ
jgi:hypothetical protein